MKNIPTSPLVGTYDIQFGGFDKLMPFRIREVLLVAAPYDSFLLADDDALTELVFSEYLDLNLRYAPRVTRVTTPEEAVERIAKEEFDLIITMASVGSLDVAAFAREVKSRRPELPVILLCFNTMDVAQLSDEDRSAVDRVFVWLGDPRIFMSIIKLVEDERNIDHDIALSNVQAIIVIEDSVRFYSSYLPILYAELMKQTQLLMAEGINLSHKMLRMRARPKILLAHDFESGWALYQKYQANLLGVITDSQFRRGGTEDPRAGLIFTEKVKADYRDMPVLVQSSDASRAASAGAVGASFLEKTSPALLSQLQDFMLRYFGFGDFVFRDASGQEFGRASDLHGMISALKSAPDGSIEFHASRNHFSKWLMARTEFEIAYRLRPRKVAEFKDIGEMRKHLIETIHQFLTKTQLGTIIKFDGRFFDEESPFVKIGKGSIGGKARGLAFVNFLLSKTDLARRVEGVRITVPHTSVIATEVFDFFMEHNALNAFVREEHDNEALAAAFTAAELPTYVTDDLLTLVGKIRAPLAVRSSSLLEDSRTHPFAGVYKTYMLPNNDPDMAVRLEQLARAVKLVYASTFSTEARSYRRLTTHLPDEEKMAVIVQHLVGRPRAEGKRYYPGFSGVVQSYNYYPVPPITPEDGASYVALGLGKTIMDGYRSLRFSPHHPHNLHQFSTVNDTLACSQREFLALGLERAADELGYDHEPSMVWLGLDAAEEDGTLWPVGSTYSADNETICDGTSRPGVRVVTFAPILKNDVFPLTEVLNAITQVGREAMGSHVEMEFAANLDPGEEDGLKEFSILQIRPMISRWNAQKVRMDDFVEDRVLCTSPRALGNGYIQDIADILYVKPDRFDPSRTVEIAERIGEINRSLKAEGRPCLLLGPGRWGSADPSLGIPVRWHQISASRVIVETTLEGFVSDPSFGTHFFHNVTSLGLGYFTVHAHKGEGSLRWDWLERQPALVDTELLRHVRLAKPLDIRIDGSTGRGVILTPEETPAR